MTVRRILIRYGQIDPAVRERRHDYLWWQWQAPMRLWPIGIVGGAMLISGAQCKVVTGSGTATPAEMDSRIRQPG
jgi:hypothetical protein